MADLEPESDCATWCASNDIATRAHWAALQGQLSALHAFLAAGDDPNARDSRSRSPLHWAAHGGQAACIAMLAAAGADLEARGLGCGTPLHVAAEAGEAEAVRALLHAGADVNVTEREGLQLCCMTPLWLAAAAGHVAAMRELIAAGAWLDAAGMHGSTPLHAAVRNNHTGATRLLLEAGADKELRSCGGKHCTPLHLAAVYEHIGPLKELLTSGADLEARNGCPCGKCKESRTPLQIAASFGNLSAARLLIAAGANVEAVDDNGWTPLLFAAYEGQAAAVKELIAAGARWDAKDIGGWSPVHWAAAGGAAEAVAALAALAEGGADLTVRTAGAGLTPLHCAAFRGNVEAVKWLLQKGLDLEARDSCTALHHAASSEDGLAVVEVLLAAGADITAQGIPGWTALHVAASRGCIKVMRALVAAGADMGAQDYFGRAPIHVAAAEGQVAAVLELAAAGMDINALSGRGACCLDFFAEHVGCKEVPEAPQQLASLLSAGASAKPTAADTPTTIDLLLSLHMFLGDCRSEPRTYFPDLIRMLAAAGCPLGKTAGSAASFNQASGLQYSTFAYWLSRRPARELLWPPPLSAGDIGVAKALLQGMASQGYSLHKDELVVVFHRGDTHLLQALLEAFPQCLQQLECALFPATGLGYRPTLGVFFIRRLRQLPVPPEGVLPEQHRSLVLRFCELADMLLAAGCQRQSICIKGRQVPGSVRRLGLGRALSVRLPGWAMDILSFLPLLAAGVEWSPESHPDFPPALRTATRELLTINHCCGFGAGPSLAAAGGIGAGGTLRGQQGIQLPDDMLHYILRLASRPFPAWFPQLSSSATVCGCA